MTTHPTKTPVNDATSPVERDVVGGGGAAGLSAAVFLARYGLETLVLARGQSAIHQCAQLENYLGFSGGVSPERFRALGRSLADEESRSTTDRTEEHASTVPSGEDGTEDHSNRTADAHDETN